MPRRHVHLVVIQWRSSLFVFFFFQAEDGIRDYKVTGVQTCALPILRGPVRLELRAGTPRARRGWRSSRRTGPRTPSSPTKIGRASCKGKSVDLGGRRIIKKKKKEWQKSRRWTQETRKIRDQRASDAN